MQNFLEESLFDAIEINDVSLVKELLSQGVNANVKNHDGDALHVALRWGSQETVKLLLEYGADVKVLDACGYTALHWAARKCSSEIVTLLLYHGADVHAQDYEGKTPLHMVRNKDSVILLLSCGADIKAQDMYGNTPLHEAASCTIAFDPTVLPDLIEVVSTLLEHGADPNALNKDNESPLLGAISVADSENWCIPQKDDPQVAIITLLLEAGADVNVQELHNEWAPLHLVVYRNHARMIPLLFDYGVDIHIKTKNGQTPLHLAIEQSNVNIATLLLEAGAEVNAKDENFMTSLHIAVSFDSFESLENVRMQAYSDELEYDLTPHLAFAVEHENLPVNPYGLQEIIVLLLERGADIHAQNKEGKTPYMIALEKGHTDILKLLEKERV